MRIFTGNFANKKKYQEKGLECVSIARFNKYWSGKTYKTLAPPPDIIKWEEQQYVPAYDKFVLSKLDKDKVLEELEELCGGRDCVLLCYEKEGDFCHRRLVADWLSDKVGEIKELGRMREKDLEASNLVFE